MITIGLIGAGFMGGTHAACYELLMKNGNFKVTAIADLDPDRAKKLAEKFGAKICKTGLELIASGEANTIDICLPTYLHAEHTIAAMEKGYPVFVEKPVCRHLEEAVQLLAVKKKTGVHVAVGQCIRFWPEYVLLKKLADEQTYGKILSGVFKRISPRPMWGWDQWLLDGQRSGSAALDLHIHDVDYVRFILGWPDRIKSEISAPAGAHEHIFSLLRYQDAVISIEGGWDYPAAMPFEMEYRVKFEKAIVTFNSNKKPSVMIYCEDGTTLQPAPDGEGIAGGEGLGGNISQLGGYYAELKYFLDCLSRHEDFALASLEEGVESLKLTLREIEVAGQA